MAIEEKPDAKAARLLTQQVQAVMHGQRLENIAASAFLQAHLANAALTGIIKLIRQKNLVSESELTKFLADAYNDRTNRFDNKSVIIAPPAPTLSGH